MGRLSFLFAALVVGNFLPTIGSAQSLDLPIIEKADADLDTCALGEVKGLKKNGDGFLAVRTAPGSGYRKLDEIHNGDKVWIFQQVGDWLGVVYDVDYVECGPIAKDQPVRAKGKKGWVHSNWIRLIAG